MPCTVRQLRIRSRAGIRRPVARAISLLETTIAIGILGIGLIMVAAVFPVALAQHRDSVYQARATQLASKAEAMLRNRLDPNALWSDPMLLQAGLDSPYLLIPVGNIHAGAGWELTGGLAYAAAVNGAPPGANDLRLLGADTLFDRFTPFNDADLQNAPNRLVWHGFYRRLANGAVHYAAAVSRQQRGQIFVKQMVTFPGFPALPTAQLADIWADGYRFPVPWRVTVSFDGAGRLSTNPTAPEGLAELAPPGTKIMVHGAAYSITGLAVPPAPAGRILTVSDLLNRVTVEFVGEVADLPLAADGFSFDVWVFPPPVLGGDTNDATFATEPPLIDWKVFM